MKLSIFIMALIFSANTVFSQKNEKADWAALFPEMPGCERVVQPLVQNGETFEQTAFYRPREESESENRLSYGCGTITLRLDPSARHSAAELYEKQPKSPFFRKQTVKNFDAYSETPLCGNDDRRGTTRVYFDEDKVLIVSARRGAGDLLDFVETADYERLKESMNRVL